MEKDLRAEPKQWSQNGVDVFVFVSVSSFFLELIISVLLGCYCISCNVDFQQTSTLTRQYIPIMSNREGSLASIAATHNITLPKGGDGQRVDTVQVDGLVRDTESKRASES